MKDHRHQTAASRKDIPQRCNQKQVCDGKAAREDPVKQAAKCPTTVHVKNLAFKVDDDALRGHFSQCGEVQQVLICRNAQGRSRGFGFIEFAQVEHAQVALALSDTELCGREIVVSRSQRMITQKKQPQEAVPKKTVNTQPRAATSKRKSD